MDPLEHLQMLKDRAAGLAPLRENLTRIRALRFSEPGFDRDTWREMCAKGWLGLRGAGALCDVAEKLGAGLVPEPVITGAMAAQLLPRDHLAPVLSGERIVLPAWQEEANSIDLIGGTVLQSGRLNGRKLVVPMATGADAFLVTVTGGLALVERSATGVSVQSQQTQDGGNFGTLIFENAPAQAIEGDATEALEHTIMAHAAYLYGLLDRAFAITLEHMKQRERFGRRIGAFQAMQHRVADMQVQVSLTRATIGTASYALDNAPTLGQRQAAVSRAKVRASDAALVVTRTCIQLHGGVGCTDADDIGLYLRKAMVLSPLYGSPAVHRRRFRTIAPEIADE